MDPKTSGWASKRTRKTQRDGHNSGVKIWSLCSVSSSLSHANLEQPFLNPCNKVRGKYNCKEVFLCLPSCICVCHCVVYNCVCYHCVGTYPVYIYIYMYATLLLLSLSLFFFFFSLSFSKLISSPWNRWQSTASESCSGTSANKVLHVMWAGIDCNNCSAFLILKQRL